MVAEGALGDNFHSAIAQPGKNPCGRAIRRMRSGSRWLRSIVIVRFIVWTLALRP